MMKKTMKKMAALTMAGMMAMSISTGFKTFYSEQ